MISVETLHAVSYRKALPSGKSVPCVFACEKQDGAPVGEYVVKFHANPECGAHGVMFELVAALLADHLGLPIAMPAVVQLTPEAVVGVTDSQLADVIRRSTGANFGSELLTGGYAAWPLGETLRPAILRAAHEIFVFDLLIENVDRGGPMKRPNLLVRGDDLVMIDHEQAFSFVFALGRSSEHNYAAEPYVRNHIFYEGLRRLQLDYAALESRLRTIDAAVWREIRAQIPAAWPAHHLSRIEGVIQGKVNDLPAFIVGVKEALL